MSRLGAVLLVCTVAGTTSLLLGPSNAADKKLPTAKELMAKAHKGDDSPLMRVDRQLQAEQPVWAEVRKDTDVLMELGTWLKAKEIVNYKSTKAYVESVEALDVAVQKKDKPAATASFGKLKGTCASCHKEKM
jgi:hypothetical protein